MKLLRPSYYCAPMLPSTTTSTTPRPPTFRVRALRATENIDTTSTSNLSVGLALDEVGWCATPTITTVVWRQPVGVLCFVLPEQHPAATVVGWTLRDSVGIEVRHNHAWKDSTGRALEGPLEYSICIGPCSEAPDVVMAPVGLQGNCPINHEHIVNKPVEKSCIKDR